MGKDKQNIIILSIIYVILAILLFKQSGNIMIDFSRESYIPYQMLKGEKLYSDIFLIYGPMGYFINMFLYKLKLNINILLIEANLIAYFCAILFYLTLKKFTTKSIALITTIFFITVSIFSNSNFSFVVPYSYSTLWAVFALYLILFSYLYKYEKIRYIALGFLFTTKIEFFTLALIFSLFYDIYHKKMFFKNYALCLIFPIISLIGFNFNDFIKNYNYISTMLHTNALSYLYKSMGSFFEIDYFLRNLIYLALYLTFGSISYFIYKKNKFLSILILVLLFYFIYPNTILHLGFFGAICLTIINKNKIKKRDLILLYFAILLCSKSIFAINSLLYSNFGYSLLVFYIFRQLYLILNKKWVLNHFFLLIIMLLTGQFFSYLSTQKFPIKTSVGTIYLSRNDYILQNKINSFIKQNIKKDENFIVVPEGQIVNLIHKKPWKYYNSTFTPLDFETFGEEKIINQLKENKTDYIIFYPRNTKEYGAQTICHDYGVDFCTYIMDNYKRVAIFENVQKALVFKINEK
ncbi:MAG: hypothetical protein IJ877_07620 [Candidatus Gastranaerophilales bacterium]|nr:hypothetical protein [Candidatus Gastranaerophilales bacterium]